MQIINDPVRSALHSQSGVQELCYKLKHLSELYYKNPIDLKDKLGKLQKLTLLVLHYRDSDLISYSLRMEQSIKDRHQGGKGEFSHILLSLKAWVWSGFIVN